MKYVSWGEVMEREEQYKQEKRQRVKKKPAVVEEAAVAVAEIPEIVEEVAIITEKEPTVVAVAPSAIVVMDKPDSEPQRVTVNAVLDYISKDKSAVANEVVVSCFGMIMKTLAEQMQAS
jgi:hypothetical protein